MIASGLGQNGPANAALDATLEPAKAKSLRELSRELGRMRRRRDFNTVPMIREEPDSWDSMPLEALLAYKGGPKLAWDNTDLTGPWLNGMRNSVNSQVWSFKQPNFLCVSARHGSAHLALYDQQMWDKYQLAKLAGGRIDRNRFIEPPPASTHDPADFQSADGVFSSQDNSIVVLQRRGVVFLACHNAIWELAKRLLTVGQNPDQLAVGAVAADLTNHLIADCCSHAGRRCHAGETTTVGIRLCKVTKKIARLTVYDIGGIFWWGTNAWSARWAAAFSPVQVRT